MPDARHGPSLHLSRGGPRGAPTLLLIHPMGGDHTFWDACRPVWERHFDCIAPDLRGAGLSPASAGPLAIEDHADDLAALVARLGLSRVVPVGCAVGAMVATALAARHRGLCKALVLSNPGFRTRPEARQNLAARAAAVRAGGMAAALPAAIESAFAGCPDDARKAAYARRFAALDPEAYALEIEGMLEADTSPWLGAIRCPILIVAGGRDGLLPPAHAEAIAQRLPHARLERLPDGAHFIPYQRPAEFAALVGAFLCADSAPGH